VRNLAHWDLPAERSLLLAKTKGMNGWIIIDMPSWHGIAQVYTEVHPRKAVVMQPEGSLDFMLFPG
jgi:hypothetical protein